MFVIGEILLRIFGLHNHQDHHFRWNQVIGSSKLITGRFWLKLTKGTEDSPGFDNNPEVIEHSVRKYPRLVWIGTEKIADPIVNFKAMRNISKFVTTLSLFDIQFPSVTFFVKFLKGFESLSHLHSSGETKIIDYNMKNLKKPPNFNLQLDSLTLRNKKVLLDGVDGICKALCLMEVKTRELYLHDDFSIGRYYSPYQKFDNLLVILEFLKHQDILNHFSVTSDATANVYKLLEFINASETIIPSLESFTLEHTLIDLANETYSNSFVKFLKNHSNTLKDLKIYVFEETVKEMIKDGIFATIKNQMKIEHFLLYNMDGEDLQKHQRYSHEFPCLTGENLSIKTSSPNLNLKTLTLKDVKLENPKKIFKAFPAIESLAYNTDDIVNSTNQVIPNAAKRLKFLKHLSLGTLQIENGYRLQTLENFKVKLNPEFREPLEQFLDSNPNIKTLICEQMNDFEAFIEVMNNKELPKLEHLIMFSKRPEINDDPDFNLKWREKESNLLMTIASAHKNIRIDLIVALGLNDRSEPRPPEIFHHENSTLRIVEVSKYHITTQIDELLLKKLHPHMPTKCHKCTRIYKKSEFSLGTLCEYHVHQRDSFMDKFDEEFHDDDSRDDEYEDEDFSAPEYSDYELEDGYSEEDYDGDY